MARSPSEGSAKTGSKALGDLLVQRREQLGISRQKLAELSGVPYPTIAQIETGYRGVSPSRLGLIARALGLDPAKLYDVLATDEPSSPSRPSARARAQARRRTSGEDWLANPAYTPVSAPVMSAQVPMSAAAPPSYDVVEQVVALLSELPPDDRLDALGRVQSRLLAGLVQEEVRRATRRSRGS
jgi:transcriptional regulator with XRE-family HTH domain